MIKVREKDAQTKAKGSPARRKAVLEQKKKGYEEWKRRVVEYTMRCMVWNASSQG